MSITDKYTIKDELGRGAFSIVRLAEEKSTGTKYAVKIINKSTVGADLVRLTTEMEILKKVNHPNIIKLKEIIDTKNALFIVTELVTGGELFDKIVEIGQYTERNASILVAKIVSAISYLHDLNIVHRDLKPENLLLKNAQDIHEIKIADFGLSKIVGAQALMTACGTPGYVAPEVLSSGGYGPEVDMWSVGVITYILLCGFPPFYHEELPELFEQIMSASYDFPEEYWKDISKNAKDFIRNLLVVDPTKRLTGKTALQHAWLVGQAPQTALPTKELNKYVSVRKQQSKLIGAELTWNFK